MVLVTVTLAAIVALNVEFVNPGPYSNPPYYETYEYGVPFTFWIAEEVVEPEEPFSSTEDNQGTGEMACEAETIMRGPWWSGGPYPGPQLDGLVFDVVIWGMLITIAWVAGDQSSIPRAVRDRLRKVKRRAPEKAAT